MSVLGNTLDEGVSFFLHYKFSLAWPYHVTELSFAGGTCTGKSMMFEIVVNATVILGHSMLPHDFYSSHLGYSCTRTL